MPGWHWHTLWHTLWQHTSWYTPMWSFLNVFFDRSAPMRVYQLFSFVCVCFLFVCLFFWGGGGRTGVLGRWVRCSWQRVAAVDVGAGGDVGVGVGGDVDVCCWYLGTAPYALYRFDAPTGVGHIGGSSQHSFFFFLHSPPTVLTLILSRERKGPAIPFPVRTSFVSMPSCAWYGIYNNFGIVGVVGLANEWMRARAQVRDDDGGAGADRR